MPCFLGIELHRVGDDGSVWKWHENKQCWKKRKTWILPNGYEQIGFGKNHVVTVWLVHRLVLTSFAGPCPESKQGCHNDGDSLNNRLENLRWDTLKNNQADRNKHGTGHQETTARGTRRWNAKLNDDKVREIKRLLRSGRYTQTAIAKMFKVTDDRISCIARGTAWVHVT